MQRVKNVDYDEDDLYSDEEAEEQQDEGYTDEDRANFDTLIPVVRAELQEAGLQASDREIEDALWHYYWDVGKSVAYLKNIRTPRQQQPAKKKEKVKSKFDEAAAKSAQAAGNSLSTSMSGRDWFYGLPWSAVPLHFQGELSPAYPSMAQQKLLGGSSKLAKLAEERRKRAAASQSSSETANGALSSLDRLSKPKDAKENASPQTKPEVRKYPVRQKRPPTPPPKEPSPAPEEPQEQLQDLRTKPTTFGEILSTSPSHVAYGATETTLQDLFPSLKGGDPFKGPSPDDTVIHAQQNSKSKAAKKGADGGLAKKIEALQLDTPPPTPKVKSKGLDVPKLWAESKAQRRSAAAFVVIGHVDHGKSTLMGRLLLDTGAVAQRDIDKYKKQAAELNRASFALAWVMDTGSEERERGVTVDIAQHPFHTASMDFTILDAPGHRDFVPNMLAGASMADLAVLVVDANQLESGMKGQTKEHILLAEACGLKRVVVAVNKMDATMPTPWVQDIFNDVQSQVQKLLTVASFAPEDITFVPVSGLSGGNVVTPLKESGSGAWVSKSSSTLLQALEQHRPSSPAEDTVKAPLRMQITDVFRGSITKPLSVSGRITAGNIQVGEIVLVQPSGEKASIRALEVSGEPRDWVVAGELCTLHLSDIDPMYLHAGDTICSIDKPVVVVRNCIVRIEALEMLLPQDVDVHLGRLHTSGSLVALIVVVDAKGGVIRKKPRVVKVGEVAKVKLTLESGVPLVVGDRVVLRSGGNTVAAGTVERIAS